MKGMRVLLSFSLVFIVLLVVLIFNLNMFYQNKIDSLVGSGGSAGEVTEFNKITLEESGFIFPIRREDFIRYSSPFGVRISPFGTGGYEGHNGLDIVAVWRSRIVAIEDGVVVDHYPPPKTPTGRGGYFRGHDVYGGYIVIEHGDGVVSTYAHLHESYVRIGKVVQKGEVIGRMGNTGRSTGDHLHFELIIDGEYVNPLLYVVNFIEQ